MTVREVFTTGDVAKVLCIAPRTVVKACDSGLIPHFKIQTKVGYKPHRRIMREALVAYMEQNDIPLSLLTTYDERTERDATRLQRLREEGARPAP